MTSRELSEKLAAAGLNLAPGTVRHWIGRGAPKDPDGFQAFYREHRRSWKPKPDAGPDSLDEARRQECIERTAMLRLQRLEKERILVNLSEVQTMLRDSLLPIRQRLLALPTEADTRCNPTDPAHARAALQIWVDSALTRIREAVAEVVDPPKPKPKRKAKK